MTNFTEIAMPLTMNAQDTPASPETPSDAGVEDRARSRSRQTRLATTFNGVVAVLMRDRNFRNLRLLDLEQLVIPPLLAGQCRLGHSSVPAPKGGEPSAIGFIPVATALWARVSDAVDAELAANLDKPVVLRPGDWTSGDHLWLMAVAGEAEAIPRFLSQLQGREFKDRAVKLRARGEGGATGVMLLAEYCELRRNQKLH